MGEAEQPEIYRHVHPHGRATAILARSFAAALQGDGDPALDEIELGAHLHDFGKYLVPKSLLLKPGPLTEAEREVISLHPVYGANILSGLPGVTATVLRLVLHHHERWDGAGYPEGLQGTRIPLAARLVSVADVYTSLRARRSYKPALTKREAVAEMEAMAGRELDPDLTCDFLKFIGGGLRRGVMTLIRKKT
ncbi:MAG TPA: HD domain-containing phosphohydrolase [Pyrinomonadaceae bacterium]|nr:HD domain-containing phosphohydrolase [Pyrinomonadaceae bacterium]